MAPRSSGRVLPPVLPLAVALTLAACGGDGPSLAGPDERAPLRPLEVVPAFLNLQFDQPVALAGARDGTLRLYVAERRGRFFTFDNDLQVEAALTFLDIRDRVAADGPGVLAFAFHPDFRNNGQLFVHYVAEEPTRTVLSRFTRSGEVADPGSEEILLEVEQPGATSLGGGLAFGEDGFLYVALGDGSPEEGDPTNDGQNATILRGSVLRLDVDRRAGGLAYGIPEDNPLVGNANGWREEIWAWGFHDPTAASLDPNTGNLWVTDLGTSRFDEVNLVEGGLNYGWPVMEGTVCHFPPAGCNRQAYTEPILAYGGTSDGRRLVGGHTYAGFRTPQLFGLYLFADRDAGQLWGMLYTGSVPPPTSRLLEADPGIITIAEDPAGEPVMANAADGKLYRFSFTAN